MPWRYVTTDPLARLALSCTLQAKPSIPLDLLHELELEARPVVNTVLEQGLIVLHHLHGKNTDQPAGVSLGREELQEFSVEGMARKPG